MNAEVWKPIPGYEDRYCVSSLGRVSNASGHILAPTSGKSLYQSMRLSNGSNLKTTYVHHMALLAFIGACPDGMQACHGDGDRQNNAIANLRWGTATSNHADKRAHGTNPAGERHPFAKLTDELVVALRKRRVDGASITTLANEFSVSRMTASRAASSKSWSHI